MLLNHLLDNITILPVVMIYLLLLCSGGVSNPQYFIRYSFTASVLKTKVYSGRIYFPCSVLKFPGVT